jgi:CRISPR/Cas system CMR-associated protein Cmr5 small subunit
VPIADVAYFMKQPIIREYLRMIENNGYSYLFIDNYVNEMSLRYKSKSSATVEKIPAFSKLQSVIRKDVKDLTEDEKLEQQFMLREFLKYAKMAEQLFYVSQGTNFDTANLNDPFLVFKKMEQLERAKNTIFSDVEEFMKASFLGNLGEANADFRNLASNFLLSDRGQVRNTIQDVLRNYTDMNDYDFLKIAQTTVLNLFDWAVQNDQALNTKIEEILISETGTASKIAKFLGSIKEGHPLYGNYVVDVLSPRPSQRVGQANNLYIKNKANKVYDQNRTIYAFEELKSYLTSQGKTQLYDDLVKLSILTNNRKKILTNTQFIFN